MPASVTSSVPGLRFLPVGREALLVEVADGPAALALFNALTEARPADVIEFVPAARTVLVRFRPGRGAAARIIETIRSLPVRSGGRPAGAVVEIPVVYDGEDLAAVAALTGLSVDEVVSRHTAPTYDVAFTGFAPGFAYLTGGDARLEMPRRPTPRTAIPAGAVGIAGPFSGVYPRVSPGGWQLVGRTSTPMWDLDRTLPALLVPGARVRFVRAELLPERSGSEEPASEAQASEAPVSGAPVSHQALRIATPTNAVVMRGSRREPPSLQVLAPGMLSLVEDLGRPGKSALGVSGSGAVDRPAFRQVNRLLGNDTDAAVIEHVGGGLEVLVRGSVVVAVTGATGPLWIERAGADDEGPLSTEVERGRPLLLRDGDVLVVGPAETGVVAYVGVLGGLDVPLVLGSRATDVLSGLGPVPLRAGSVLPVGIATRGAVSDVPEPGPGLPSGAPAGRRTEPRAGTATRHVVTVDVTLGPRDDWFTAEALTAFTSTDWLVTPQSNRVGTRLTESSSGLAGSSLAQADPSPAWTDSSPVRAGSLLVRAVRGELPSEATIAGAVQIPADGQPVVFLADHPVTGGYPVIAVVVPEHLGRVAQCPAGTFLRFRVVSVE